ncbi:3'-5' exonuclease [Lachnospiraceae bacterium 47-T17]
MRYAVVDVETTGLGRKDEVIQFACILADENFNAMKLYNTYCYTQHPIDPRAFAVHKLDKETLLKLSKGRTLEDNIVLMKDLFNQKDITWVEYSNNGFDLRLINQTLINNGASAVDFGKRTVKLDADVGIWNYSIMHGICNLLFGGRMVKLSQAVKSLPYTEENIRTMFRRYVSLNKTNSDGFHNADFDAFVTWLLLYAYGKKLRY